MSKRTSGYLLPSGDAFTEELCCALVFYPDKDEYRRALLGSLGYFSTWMAWETDSAKRGKDAARAWRLAEEKTLECWEMACLDELISDVNSILLLLQQGDKCCSTHTSYESTTIVTTIIQPGVGGDPSYYGETAVADWEEWYEHLCWQANQYVDRLIDYGRVIDTFFVSGGLTLDAWSYALNILQFSGLPIPFYIVDAVEWLADFFTGVSDTWFADVTDDLESSRDDIVCAIINDGPLDDVVEASLTSGLAWTIFYSLIDYDQVKAVLYEGGWDDEYLPTEKSTDCGVCEYTQQGEGDLHIDWIYGDDPTYDSGNKEWTVDGHSVGGCHQIQFRIYEDDTETVLKQCRLVVTSCDGSGQCAAYEFNQGWVGAASQWNFSIPHLVDESYAAIDKFQHLHVGVGGGGQHTLTFKLYQ